MKESIYKELERELKKKKISYMELKEVTGISVNALVEKRKGTRDWRLSECLVMKNLLCYAGTIEQLFEIDKNCADKITYNKRELI